VVLHRAQADFYGGRMTGEFDARLSPVPSYSLTAEVSRANLAALAGATPALAGRFAGVASGELTLAPRGIGSSRLLASLNDQGALQVRDAALRGIDFASEGQNSPEPPAAGEDRFSAVSAKFHVTAGHVHVDESLFSGRETQFEAAGDVDFARRLDFRVQYTGG